MIPMCAIAVLTISNSINTPASQCSRTSLAVGDVLGLQMVEVQGLPTPPAIRARAARLAQASQTGSWWQLPDESTVVARGIDR